MRWRRESLPCQLCPLFPGEVSHPNISGHSGPEILPVLGTNCQGHTGINSVVPPVSCPLPLRFWGRDTALKMMRCPAYVCIQSQEGCPWQGHWPRNFSPFTSLATALSFQSQHDHVHCQPPLCHSSHNTTMPTDNLRPLQATLPPFVALRHTHQLLVALLK